MRVRTWMLAAVVALSSGLARAESADPFAAELPRPDPALLQAFTATNDWLLEQSKSVDPVLQRSALYNLGWLWEHGPDRGQQSRALEWYRKAQAAGSAEAELRLLSLAQASSFGLKADAQTRNRIEASARAGLAQAYIVLGACLQTASCGQPADYPGAFAAFREASRLGLSWGTIMMGVLIRNGNYGPERKAAEAYFRQAIEEGAARGYSLIGRMYEEADGVPAQPAKARALFAQGAALGDSDSMLRLGAMLRSGTGGPRDIQGAVVWLGRALDAAEPDAAAYLGLIYEDGVGVAQDYPKAAAIFRRGIALQNLSSMNNLGMIYLNGRVPEPRPGAGVHWLETAFESGDALAACNLAEFYRKGLGVPKDLRKAREWNMKGAQQQSPDCEYALGVMTEDGDLQPGGPAEAIRWYTQAALHGSDAALNALRRLGAGDSARR